jgi:ubiquinone/menaquinone biosynthesis C-methylase UbiE
MLTAKDWDRRFAQQALWTRELRHHIYNRVGLHQLNHIIEIGCGTGAILVDFENQDNNIFGLDISEQYIRLAQQKNTNSILTIGDANFLPFMDSSFDIVLCHYFMLWMNDPILTLQEMKRIAGRGSSILVLAEPDYSGRLDYPDELNHLGQAQIDSLINQGADPFIGRRLGGLFHASGISLIEMGILGGQWGHKQSQEIGDEEWQMLLYDLQFLPEQGEYPFIGQTELTHLKKIHHNAVQSGERVMFIPTFYAWGKVNK